MSRRSKDKESLISIIDVTHEGFGIGHLENGRLLHVPCTATGDIAQVRVGRKKKGAFRGELLALEKESSDRIAPRCKHFGSCGGCKTQHLSYEKQLSLKQGWVVSLFPEEKVLPILPCSAPWNYRNKMEFSFSEDRLGTKYLGLMRQRGRVESLSECHIAQEWMLSYLEKVRLWWEESSLAAYDFHKDKGSLRTLTCRGSARTGEKMAILTVSGNPDFALSKEEMASFAAVSKDLDSVFVQIQQIQKGSPTQFYEVHLKGEEHYEEQLTLFGKTLRFKVSPKAFFQPNSPQAELLYSKALELAAIEPEETVWDLYCGTGTLTLAASTKAKKAVGIEIVADAVYDARENAQLNGIENAEFIKGDVGILAEQLRASGSQLPDICLVDPPRVGLDEKALAVLTLLNPKKIVYISCNPKSQAENIQMLKESGYTPRVVQPVDQFPHTGHVENIVLLEKAQ